MAAGHGHRGLSTAWLIGCLALLAGCTSFGTTPRVGVDGDARWAVLPIENLSGTPLAGRRAASLLESHLRRRGVSRVARLETDEPLELVALLETVDERGAARERARLAGYRYALGGTVHEWQYRAAPDREPVVGLGLQLEDLATGEVIWSSHASKGGWGTAHLSGVADDVVDTLLDRVRVLRDAP